MLGLAASSLTLIQRSNNVMLSDLAISISAIATLLLLIQLLR